MFDEVREFIEKKWLVNKSHYGFIITGLNRIAIHFPCDESRMTPGQASLELIVSWFLLTIDLTHFIHSIYYLLNTHALSLKLLIYSVLKHNIYAGSFGNIFQSFTTLWENVYFLMSNLEWHIAKARRVCCPTSILNSEKHIIYLTSHIRAIF